VAPTMAKAGWAGGRGNQTDTALLWLGKAAPTINKTGNVLFSKGCMRISCMIRDEAAITDDN